MWRSCTRSRQPFGIGSHARRGARAYTSEETAKDRGRLGVDLDAQEVAELGDDTSIDAVLGRQESGADDRLVRRDVRAEVQALLGQRRLGVGHDLADVALDTSGDSLGRRDGADAGVDRRSDRSRDARRESVLVQESRDVRVDEGALVVDAEKATKELAETERSLDVRPTMSNVFGR